MCYPFIQRALACIAGAAAVLAVEIAKLRIILQTREYFCL